MQEWDVLISMLPQTIHIINLLNPKHWCESILFRVKNLFTLKPIRDLRKYTLNSEVSTFPQRAFHDSILSAKIVGDIPRSFPRSSILDMPRHEKKNIYSTSICASVLFSCIPKEEFLMRGTDETFMVKTAVCPITLI